MTQAEFLFIPMFKKERVEDAARKVRVKVNLNHKDDYIELRKELVPVMLKLIEAAWQTLRENEPLIQLPIGAMVANFFNDDSGAYEDEFFIISVNNDGTGFYCGNVFLIPELNSKFS